MEKIFYLIRDYWDEALKIGFFSAISFKFLQIATCVVGRLLGRYVMLEWEKREEKIVNKVVEKIEERLKK